MNKPTPAYDYSYLPATVAAKQWERIGARRRAGVIAPLFSVYSKKSVGIGEIPDLALLADWCAATGQSLIQLLPLQDVAFDFCPYDAVSSFALDPMYLRLESLRGIPRGQYRDRIQALREKYPTGGPRVNYQVKAEKLAILWEIFTAAQPLNHEDFSRFQRREKFWLDDYALYKVIRYLHLEKSWLDWDPSLRDRKPEALERVRREHAASLLFHQWVQWQLWEQMRAVKAVAAKKDVWLIGDLPFLVSRNSADVWANPSFFKMHLSSGAPPDYFMQAGQRWGMPPYDWSVIAADGYRYLIEKLRYAQEFYDLYRIDHAIGMFRIWTIRMEEPLESGGRNGAFDPPDERVWEEHGSRILSVIAANTRMLPCAEDLGVVPACSAPTLKRFGLPGMDIQRWMRDPKNERRILPPEEYRTNAIATLTTHDMYPVIRWWKDLPAHEKREFAEYFGWDAAAAESVSPLDVVTAALEGASRSAAIFSVQALQDWLSLGLPEHDAHLYQPTNVPGFVSPENWSWVAPMSLEKMGEWPHNPAIARLHQDTRR